MSCKNQHITITEAALPYPDPLLTPPYCAIQGSQDGLKIPFVPIPLPQIQKQRYPKSRSILQARAPFKTSPSRSCSCSAVLQCRDVAAASARSRAAALLGSPPRGPSVWYYILVLYTINNCFAWWLTSRYLFEGAQGMLFLTAVLDPSQAAPGLCPHPKVLLPAVSRCSALPVCRTSAPRLLTCILSVSNPSLEMLHLPGRSCPGIPEEKHLHSS